jgi:N-acyl-D-amino-acid deacylase
MCCCEQNNNWKNYDYMHFALLLSFLLLFTNAFAQYDIILKNGMIYDGFGGEPFQGDVAIRADTIAAIGNLSSSQAKQIIDVTGRAISPGFINMLSWADGTLLKDGRSMSDIKQGVTLEVFGEGWSPGPRKKKNSKDTLWTTLDGYFKMLERKGVSPNVASFVGATTVRNLVLGYENRKPNPEELAKMKGLVEEAMKQGAMGVGSSLIYAPADYASTKELIELNKVVAKIWGYVHHPHAQ